MFSSTLSLPNYQLMMVSSSIGKMSSAGVGWKKFIQIFFVAEQPNSMVFSTQGGDCQGQQW
jgi:hypothetical protein